jgi:hypothetical protein
MIRSFFLLGCVITVGCSARPTFEGTAAQVPEPFTLELRVNSGGQRAVYYVLEPDASLHFGGGRFANIRQAVQDAGILSPEERGRLWQIVVAHRLLAATGQLLPKGQTIYELKVRAGPYRNSLTAADDSVPGLDELDRALFEIQARRRYEEP